MVREAISTALHKPLKKNDRPRRKLKAAVKFIDAILEGDRKAPRKQRHAHRIGCGCSMSLLSVRSPSGPFEYVRRKIALGFVVRETCVPQSYSLGRGSAD